MDVTALPFAFPLFWSKENRRPLVNDVQTMAKFLGKLYAVIHVLLNFVFPSLRPVLIKYLTLGIDLHVESWALVA